MAVQLVATIQRFQAYAGDPKPIIGGDNKLLAVGSECLELDTGDTYRWDGFGWRRISGGLAFTRAVNDTGASLLDEILTELRLLRTGLITADDSICAEVDLIDIED